MRINDGSKPWPTPLDESDDGQVLVPLLDGDTEMATEIATDLARQHYADVVVLGPVATAESSVICRQEANAEVAKHVQLLAGESDVTTTGVIRTGESAERVVTDTVENHPVTTLVVPTPADAEAYRPFRGGTVEKIETGADCTVVFASGTLQETPSSVLLPVASGPHSAEAVGVARRIAVENDAHVEVLHVVSPDAAADDRETAHECVETGVERLGGGVDAASAVVEASDPATAIVERAAEYDLTVLGAPTKGRLRQFVFGSVPENVAADPESAVLTVRSRDAVGSGFGRWF